MTPYALFTWNLLAPEWTSPHPGDDRDFYRHARPYEAWRHRRPLLLDALRTVDAELICLQEVSAPFYRRFLGPLLRGRGFEPVFRARRTGAGDIGVLVAHDTRRFIDLGAVDFTDPELAGRMAGTHLRPVEGGPTLTVATAHLPWSPEESVRRERLDRALATLDLRTSDGAQILAGDVNFDPHAHPAWSHWAAAGWATSHPQPDMPTWAADGRTERLDAILARGAASGLEGDPVPALSPIPGLPSAAFPSDHVSLRARFRL